MAELVLFTAHAQLDDIRNLHLNIDGLLSKHGFAAFRVVNLEASVTVTTSNRVQDVDGQTTVVKVETEAGWIGNRGELLYDLKKYLSGQITHRDFLLLQ